MVLWFRSCFLKFLNYPPFFFFFFWEGGKGTFERSASTKGFIYQHRIISLDLYYNNLYITPQHTTHTGNTHTGTYPDFFSHWHARTFS